MPQKILQSIALFLCAIIVYLMIYISFRAEQFPAWLTIGAALGGSGIFFWFFTRTIWKK
jgi:hypothetical protein